MTRTPLDGRPLRTRLLEAAAAPTAAEPTTDLQKSAYADGQGFHAKGSTRPNHQMAGAVYGDEAPWLIRGWDDAAEATVEPATFVCRSCKDEEHLVVPGEDDSVWCVCGARLDAVCRLRPRPQRHRAPLTTTHLPGRRTTAGHPLESRGGPTMSENYGTSAREANLEQYKDSLAARMNVEKTKDGWILTTEGTLSDTDAGLLTFRAEPEQITLGEYVEVVDAQGIRTGHICSAIYREPVSGLLRAKPYVVCQIELS
jgi:hypothetical protein